LYPKYETDISQEHLTTVFSQMKEPVCLLGGWAVYLTVNARFNQDQGRNYLGSRDIDLGFHIDPAWSKNDLQKSAFAQSVKILADRGFVGLGSRFVKYYDINTKEELTEAQARRKQSYDIFQLYVDPMADNPHADAAEIVGFPLLDEPLLSHVFSGEKFVSMDEFGGKFKMPAPEILVSTKLKSAPDRTKDDKRIKDISDMYALLWYSEVEFGELKHRVQGILGDAAIRAVTSKFTEDDYAAVAAAIGLDAGQISRVIGDLAR
jgi:hypothetical protein